MTRANNWRSIGRISWRTASFKYPQRKKITRWKIGRTRGPRHVSETGNEVPGKHVSNNGHWLICSVRCGTILLKVANPEEKNADHLFPPLGLPTEYYPFKRCQVPVGHSVLLAQKACSLSTPVRSIQRLKIYTCSNTGDRFQSQEATSKPGQISSRLIDYIWVRDLTAPMHLGLINGPFVPHIKIKWAL